MSATGENGDRHQEIIIVRRGHDDEEGGHHGGAWKIAFADFMTAMMCFFLVMWLINASNEETKAAVASYFNPVKLIDRNATRKGLEETGDGPHAVGMEEQNAQSSQGKGGVDGRGNAGPDDKQNSSASTDASKKSDDHLFADPYAVLSEIASDTDVKQNISEKGDGGAQTSGPATGASGGEAYRDPFAPDFWSQQVASPGAEASAERAREGLAEMGIVEGDKGGGPTESTRAETPAAKTGDMARPDDRAATPPPPFDAPTATEKAEAEAIGDQIAKSLGRALPEGMEVKATSDGIVISLTEQLDFGMYEIGSAVPRRDLVLAMEKIGEVLAEHPGTISIKGHTDARPFRNKSYDNWRLSGARAQSAYYMLTRGGLDEKRVTEVAGYADRQLKLPADPTSPANRRIEILLKTDRQ